MSFGSRAAWLGIFGLLAGCSSAPVETFYAHERPEKTATIVEADGAACQMVNRYVIGADPEVRFMNSMPNTPYVVPAGTVTMVVGYFAKNGAAPGGSGFGLTVTKPWTAEPKQIAFVAEAGHTYSFVTHYGLRFPNWAMRMAFDDWDLDVIDKETKAVVAATHDRQKKAATQPAESSPSRE